jgi:hypothetical protein
LRNEAKEVPTEDISNVNGNGTGHQAKKHCRLCVDDDGGDDGDVNFHT